MISARSQGSIGGWWRGKLKRRARGEQSGLRREQREKRVRGGSLSLLKASSGYHTAIDPPCPALPLYAVGFSLYLVQRNRILTNFLVVASQEDRHHELPL